MATSTVGTKGTPAAQLRALIEQFDPTQQKLIRSVRAALRKRMPTANELVYDYSHSLVISYSPTDRGIEGVISTSARAGGVDLFFNHGPQLPDPKKLLKGSGKQTRFISLESAGQLKHPDVEALIIAAIDASDVPLPSTGRGKIIIRTDAATKRVRKKPTK